MMMRSRAVSSIGIESAPKGIKCALIKGSQKHPSIQNLFFLNHENKNVKPLYKHLPILTSCLEGIAVLVRPLTLPLTKEKDISAALTFQAEPLLPYPVDEALLNYQIIEKFSDSSLLTLLSARKNALTAHLDSWQLKGVEPERVSSLQSALCEFGAAYLPKARTYLILHLQHQSMTCILIKEGKLVGSFSSLEGLELLGSAQAKDDSHLPPQNHSEWKQLVDENKLQLAAAASRLQKGVTRMGFALSKEMKGQPLEGIAITGEGVEWRGLTDFLIEGLSLPILTCEPVKKFSSEELHSYAVPIGLAVSSLPGQALPIDFRQGEWSYPYPWRRLKKPLFGYLIAVVLATAAFYFFSQHYLLHEEDKVKQAYVDLLAGMGKTPEQFETAYESKTPAAREKFSEGIPTAQQLSQEDLIERINFLQKDLRSTPDSFPLFANIPRVSDVLAWLSQHEAVSFTDENGQKQGRLQIENFSYTMVKRPQLGKKQEKYQVKIEMEFSSPTPKWAREFHDALIAPNDWVDPKAEVKWSSNRGKYKTSFFLKDKTFYPGQ